MLLLREAQLHALAADARLRFEAEMLRHVARYFPDKCRPLGVDGVKQAIRDGIDKAIRRGITIQRDQCRFVDLAFALGFAFDTELPWAAAILDDPLTSSATARVERLYTEARRRLERA